MKEAKTRYNLERKIEKYRENKSVTDNESIVSLAEEKRRNLLKLFDDIENEDHQRETQSVASSIADLSNIKEAPKGHVAPNPVVDFVTQQKFEDLEYLQQAKSKINELSRIVETTRMELLEANKNVLALKELLEKERQRSKETEKELETRNQKYLEAQR